MEAEVAEAAETSPQTLEDITIDLAAILDPPRRTSVFEAVAEGMFFEEGVKWDAELVPYLERPMNETESRHHDVVCFMGPARTGKTLGLILGRYYYIVKNHPLDFILVHSSKTLARDLSMRELERMHKFSPGLKDQLTGAASDENTFDKSYKSGIIAALAWPSITQLASRTFPFTLATDYGRWINSVGGQGSGFQQLRKRTETAMSLAMNVVESSPGSTALHVDAEGNPWIRPAFELGKPLVHAAPPTISGSRADIVPIYNDGTREWWYVPCMSCGEYYPQWADISVFNWVANSDPTLAAATAGTVCNWCGTLHTEQTKKTENANGVWVAEGETIDCYGKIKNHDSRKRRGVYVSFWQGGGSAAYQTRVSIVRKYLQALRQLETTGKEDDIHAVVNGDIGAPYLPASMAEVRQAHPIMVRAEEWPQYVVPYGVRFIMASVDVQQRRWVVQIIGYGVGSQRWLIDRYNIRNSERIGPDGKPEAVDPAVFPEDWEQLTPLLNKSYPLHDESDRRMRVLYVLCDSGGAGGKHKGVDGVTRNSYAYWRSVAKRGWAGRLRLVKGANSDQAKPIEERRPDTSKQGGASRGDVPVLFINTSLYKDTVVANLARETPGPGYFHTPKWLKKFWYDELTREQKTEKGWTSPSKNEAFDLTVYCDAGADWGPPGLFQKAAQGLAKIDWENPPAWAMDWDTNSNVFLPRPEGDGDEPDSPLGGELTDDMFIV